MISTFVVVPVYHNKTFSHAVKNTATGEISNHSTSERSAKYWAQRRNELAEIQAPWHAYEAMSDDQKQACWALAYETRSSVYDCIVTVAGLS